MVNPFTNRKESAYLIALKNHESVFIKELIAEYGRSLRNEAFICPECRGDLRVIEGPYGKFIGCTNYRKTGCTYKRTLRKPR